MNNYAMRQLAAFLVMVLILSFFPAVAAADATNLRCEYDANPLAIDVANPRLSWTIESDKRGERQAAYQILAASTPEILAQEQSDLWDSGRVESDQSVHVVYAGKPLASRMQCWWKVRVWDKDGNAFGVILGNGFYNLEGGRNYANPKSYGPLKVILQLHLEYADGTSSVVVTDETWKAAISPITYSDVYGGEDFDTRIEHAGWTKPGFDDSDWLPVKIIEKDEACLKSQAAPPVKIMETFRPIKITEPSPGAFIYDFGQNCSGRPRIIDWAIRSNLWSVLTDCPHRERHGWLEEVHLMGPSIMYNYDVPRLLEKICNDMSESQTPEGLVPDVSPAYVIHADGFRDAPAWGSSSVIVPWFMYQWYGDKSVLEKHYDMMKRYVDYLTSKSRNLRRKGDILSMDITIPANTTATVYVLAKDAAGLTESGNPANSAEGVKFLRMENNAAVYAVGSGIYRFQSTIHEITK